MEYSSIKDWIEKNSIRVVRQGQCNFFVSQDVADSIGAPAFKPGQLGLSVDHFVRISIGGIPTFCLTALGVQKLYASTSGKLDLDGGMPGSELNAAWLANTKTDQVPLPEPDMGIDSPIQEALAPYLSNLFSPNNAMLVTPAMAKILLGGNLKNRPKNNRNFKRLCAQLRAGKWKVNGSTITLSRHWQLLDGQHRLFAIIETGISALCIIGFGFDPHAFATLDQGAKRTNADNLAIAGFANPKLLASVIGVYQAVKNGSVVNNKARAIDPDESVKIASTTPYLHPAVKQAGDYHRQGARFVSKALIGGLMARGMEINKRAAAKFFDFLLNDNCRGKRPAAIQKVRLKLMQDSMDKSKSTNATHVAAVIIKGWNAYRQGKTLRSAKYVPAHTVDGVTVGESFPVMA